MNGMRGWQVDGGIDSLDKYSMQKFESFETICCVRSY